MTINIALCDDDTSFIHEMDTLLQPYIFNNKNAINFDKYSDAEALIDAVVSGIYYNIYFLDIEIAEHNGIDIAKKITKEQKNDPYIIFISNYPEYMQDSFSVHPYLYLQKPIEKSKLYATIDELSEKETKKYLYITLLDTEDCEQIPVDITKILFIETTNARLQKLKFHFFNSSVTIKGTISDWAARLSDYPFLTCYKGILVNIYHIHLIKDSTIILKNGENLPISRKYLNQIKNEMLNIINAYIL